MPLESGNPKNRHTDLYLAAKASYGSLDFLKIVLRATILAGKVRIISFLAARSRRGDDITQRGNIVTLTNTFFSGSWLYQSHKMTLLRPRPRIQTGVKKLKTWGYLHILWRKNSLKVKKVTILPHLTVPVKDELAGLLLLLLNPDVQPAVGCLQFLQSLMKNKQTLTGFLKTCNSKYTGAQNQATKQHPNPRPETAQHSTAEHFCFTNESLPWINDYCSVGSTTGRHGPCCLVRSLPKYNCLHRMDSFQQ